MGERGTKYDLIIEREAREELSDIAPFYRRRIVAAIRMLSSVLYDVEDRTVRVLRVIMKKGTTGESL